MQCDVKSLYRNLSVISTILYEYVYILCRLPQPFIKQLPESLMLSIARYYNMTVWILAGNYISITIAAGLIMLHMPGVKKSRV